MVCLFVAFSGPHLRDKFTAYLSKSLCSFMGTIDISITEPFSVNLIIPIVKRFVKRLKCVSSTSDFYSNVWKLIGSEFWIPYSIRSRLWSQGGDQPCMGCYLFVLRKIHFYLMFFGGQIVYCIPPESLFVHRVEHLRTCHAKSPVNAKAVFVIHE